MATIQEDGQSHPSESAHLPPLLGRHCAYSRPSCMTNEERRYIVSPGTYACLHTGVSRCDFRTATFVFKAAEAVVGAAERLKAIAKLGRGIGANLGSVEKWRRR
jgi:hypothetical protein